MTNEKRLIDANEAEKSLFALRKGYRKTEEKCAVGECILELRDIPTVDAVEVVHGQWEKASEKMPIYRCSICKERNLFKNGYNAFSNYCPNCGAKMGLQ